MWERFVQDGSAGRNATNGRVRTNSRTASSEPRSPQPRIVAQRRKRWGWRRRKSRAAAAARARWDAAVHARWPAAAVHERATSNVEDADVHDGPSTAAGEGATCRTSTGSSPATHSGLTTGAGSRSSWQLRPPCSSTGGYRRARGPTGAPALRPFQRVRLVARRPVRLLGRTDPGLTRVVVTDADGRRLWVRHEGQAPDQRSRSIWTKPGSLGAGWVEMAEARTGRPLRIFHGRRPLWSPDGRTLVFVRGPAGGPGETLWRIAVPGTGARRIAAVEDGNWTAPRLWSPDSRRLAYYVNSVPSDGLYVIGPTGGRAACASRATRTRGRRTGACSSGATATTPSLPSLTCWCSRSPPAPAPRPVLSPDRKTVAFQIATS
jgi:hypothetical protein